MKTTSLALICAAVLLLGLCLSPATALADDSTAFVVASDQTFDGLTGMKAYLKDGGVQIVHITDKAALAQADRLLVFGAPGEEGLAGDLIRALLNENEIKIANTMGKGVLEEKQVDGKPALVFATAYSMKTFVSSHAETWKDYFESWFNIAQTITSIIGY